MPSRRSYPEMGPVKSHVRAAGLHFGNKYNIGSVGGVAPRSGPSEHPDGRALDFMTKNKAVGDALAADVLANAKAYNVIYVIWWRRINSADGGGWEPYSGASPHTDHVHVSFGEGAGSGNVTDSPASVGDTPAGSNPVVPDELEAIGAVLSFLGDPHTWLRVAAAVGGIVLVLIALVMLTKRQGAQAATKTIRRTVRVKVKR